MYNFPVTINNIQLSNLEELFYFIYKNSNKTISSDLITINNNTIHISCLNPQSIILFTGITDLFVIANYNSKVIINNNNTIIEKVIMNFADLQLGGTISNNQSPVYITNSNFYSKDYINIPISSVIGISYIIDNSKFCKWYEDRQFSDLISYTPQITQPKQIINNLYISDSNFQFQTGDVMNNQPTICRTNQLLLQNNSLLDFYYNRFLYYDFNFYFQTPQMFGDIINTDFIYDNSSFYFSIAPPYNTTYYLRKIPGLTSITVKTSNLLLADMSNKVINLNYDQLNDWVNYESDVSKISVSILENNFKYNRQILSDSIEFQVPLVNPYVCPLLEIDISASNDIKSIVFILKIDKDVLRNVLLHNCMLTRSDFVKHLYDHDNFYQTTTFAIPKQLLGRSDTIPVLINPSYIDATNIITTYYDMYYWNDFVINNDYFVMCFESSDINLYLPKGSKYLYILNETNDLDIDIPGLTLVPSLYTQYMLLTHDEKLLYKSVVTTLNINQYLESLDLADKNINRFRIYEITNTDVFLPIKSSLINKYFVLVDKAQFQTVDPTTLTVQPFPIIYNTNQTGNYVTCIGSDKIEIISNTLPIFNSNIIPNQYYYSDTLICIDPKNNIFIPPLIYDENYKDICLKSKYTNCIYSGDCVIAISTKPFKPETLWNNITFPNIIKVDNNTYIGKLSATDSLVFLTDTYYYIISGSVTQTQYQQTVKTNTYQLLCLQNIANEGALQ